MSLTLPDPWELLEQRYAPPPADPYPTPGRLAAAATGGREMQAAHLDIIDDAYAAVAAGTQHRVMIFMPPRHGKTRRASRWGPLWYLRRHPDRRVALASYGAELADEHGRWVRDQIEAPPVVGGIPFDLGLSLRRGSKAANRWDIAGRDGGMVTVGIGGALTGRGAHLLIIDDPVKDSAEADSPTMRRRAWEWWQSTALTRLEPDGAVILIQTRWHEDDLAGRILADDPDGWHVINLPALAEEDDPLGREPGDALWPQRYDIDALAEIRAAVGSRVWAALYQQRPAPLEGAIWKWPWIETNRRLLGAALPVLSRRVVAVDPSTTGKETSDECGIVVTGLGHEGDGYVLDDRTVRATPADWARAAWLALLDWEAEALVIEDNAGKDALIFVLRSVWGELARSDVRAAARLMPPIHRVDARLSKTTRAMPVAAMYEGGRIHHAADGSDRLDALERELTGWTGSGASPNRLDALVWGLTHLLLPGKSSAVPAGPRWSRTAGRR